MNRQLYIETLKSYMKKAGIVLLLGAVIAGAGGWYKHTLSQEKHAQKERAYVTMITAQAQQNAVSLIEESTVRSLTADAIGQEETAIQFRDITLRDIARADGKREGKAARHHREAKNNAGNEITVTPTAPAPQNTAAAPAPAAAPVPAIAFRPVYKVSCRVDRVKYKLNIDAVSGKVLSIKCDA